jgi:predicted alpha/beta-hydrolase family hydrolase
MRCLAAGMPPGELAMRVTMAGGTAVSADAVLPATHRPGRTPAVILAPGAGSDRRHPALRALRDGLALAGWAAVTFDFPYREAGRRVPDPAPVLERCWRAVLEAVRHEPRLAPPWLVIGGRSMGGRIASQVAAAGADVRGLVLLAFPLHPAGRPGVERAAHLVQVDAPMLFVQGTRDALADAGLLGRVLERLPRATVHWIGGADHAFRVPRRSGREPAAVSAEVLAAVAEWLDNLLD